MILNVFCLHILKLLNGAGAQVKMPDKETQTSLSNFSLRSESLLPYRAQPFDVLSECAGGFFVCGPLIFIGAHSSAQTLPSVSGSTCVPRCQGPGSLPSQVYHSHLMFDLQPTFSSSRPSAARA